MFRRKKQNLSEAHQALENAREEVGYIRERDQEIRRIVTQLRIARERNHFAETFQKILERSYKEEGKYGH